MKNYNSIKKIWKRTKENVKGTVELKLKTQWIG